MAEKPEPIGVENRRLFSRVSCELPVLIRLPDGRHLGSLLDVSVGGTRLQSPVAFELGQRLELRPQQAGDFVVLEYEVAWTDELEAGYEIGLRYPQDLDSGYWHSWVADILAGAEVKNGEILERRRMIRMGGKVTGTIRYGIEKEKVKVLDVGQGGALVQSPTYFEEGEEFDLSIASPVRVGGLRCEIRRCWRGRREWGYGVAFTDLRKRHQLALNRLLDHLFTQLREQASRR